ncbi:hypothetical protein COT48_00940 [Candidatus Woesearchaeota archaeon CG08_land_8_20_14_0_20_47_9]|nr:MAG: hypothetical protein COT48_00940 [Candidatus Woesearchaeota archaeon CG08_land_8_20_14_0_20_47_9]
MKMGVLFGIVMLVKYCQKRSAHKFQQTSGAMRDISAQRKWMKKDVLFGIVTLVKNHQKRSAQIFLSL